MSGIIAIVGRPNVGKSALFNRIAGRRIAIVHDRPGVTRDRVSAELEWLGRPYTLIDTGGIGVMRGEKQEDVLMTAAYEQVEIAIQSANVIIFVVSVQDGIVPLDEEVAKRLRESGRPVLLAVNKVDLSQMESQAIEFDQLGFKHIFNISAIHGRGTDSLMETAMNHVPESAPAAGDQTEKVEVPIKLAFVGRPNVGKSSIINAITQSERVIVSEIPGTTRDAVDVPFEVETDGVRQSYIFIDTAGIRKARRVVDAVEVFSVNRTEDSIGRSDISVLVLDAVSGILEQDKKIADIIVEKQRACIVVINKWDLVAEHVKVAREAEMEVRKNKSRNRDDKRQPLTTLGEFGDWVQEKLFFLDYAPVVFTSAKDGFHLDRLLEAIRYVAAQLKQTVPTAVLNRTMKDAVEKRQPVSKMGHRLKLFYSTQVGGMSPTFLMFVNRNELLSDVYSKYIARELRSAFGFEGCPIILKARARPKTVESIRERSTQNKASTGRRPANSKSDATGGHADKPGRKKEERPRGKPSRKTGGKTGGKPPARSAGRTVGKRAGKLQRKAVSGIRKRSQ